MTKTQSRAETLNDHIDQTGAALLAAIERVSAAMADDRITPEERRLVFTSFADCQRSLRLVVIDGQHVSAATRMLKALAHTLELTPSVARQLRESEADLVRIEAAASEPPEELFPEQAA